MNIYSPDYDHTNLLEETLSCLKDHGKDPSDIEWIRLDNSLVEKEEFLKVAEQTNYYAGFGTNEIKSGLIIVGLDWWMTRGEYDGSEWWTFHTKPIKPENLIQLTDPNQLKED